MRKLFVLFSLTLCTVQGFAQPERVNPSIEIGPQVHFGALYGEILYGYGIHSKVLFPAKDNYFTLSLDHVRLTEKTDYSKTTYPHNFWRFGAGYRKQFGSVFIEPQVGSGSYRDGNSHTMIGFLALEPGFTFGKGTYSLAWSVNVTEIADIIFSDNIHFFSLKASIRLFDKE